jgi:H+/Cl- antiporter ClcA
MALIGAACFFSGISRKTLSVTVILLEMGGDVKYLFPMMLSGLVSKFVADEVIDSVYHLLMNLKNIPFLDPSLSNKVEN